MTAQNAPNRCRLVIVAPDMADDDALAARVAQALSGGDVASLILPAYGLDEDAFQRRAEIVVPAAQQRGVAVMIAGPERIATRTGADGLHLEGTVADVRQAVERLRPRLMVGVGGPRSRDDALELGEAQPDYLFFGRIGFDTGPEPHPRNLALGAWWSEMISIPCIVQGGADLASLAAAAGTGADFVALSAALFADGVDAAAAVARANAILDEDAPSLEG